MSATATAIYPDFSIISPPLLRSSVACYGCIWYFMPLLLGRRGIFWATCILDISASLIWIISSCFNPGFTGTSFWTCYMTHRARLRCNRRVSLLVYFLLLIRVSHIFNQDHLWHFGHRIYLFFPHLMLVKDTRGIHLYSNSWSHLEHFNLLFIISPLLMMINCWYINFYFSRAMGFRIK